MPEIRTITTLEELDAELAGSGAGDVWFFKHSLICGVSDAARREFEHFVAQADEAEGRFCLVEIQAARSVSKALGERLAVQHQSPQAILARAGVAVWHASHWEITSRALAGAGK